MANKHTDCDCTISEAADCNHCHCRDCYHIWLSAVIGREIEFVRYGAPPEVSRNHRDNCREDGVSVYAVRGGKVRLVGWYFDFLERPAYAGAGTVVGIGADGEPVVKIKSIARKDKRKIKFW
jgi:hypothetical protein